MGHFNLSLACRQSIVLKKAGLGAIMPLYPRAPLAYRKEEGVAISEFSLDGKVAIVTGASRGLGKAMALALARAGADVAVSARTTAQVEQTAAQIRALGRRSVAITADVTSSQQAKEMVEKAVAALGTVHILVNNAGVVQEPGGGSAYEGSGQASLLSERLESPPLEISDDEWRLGIETNLSSAFYCIRAAVPYMLQQKWGRVISMSSVAGVRGTRASPIYSAAKGGLIMFSRALAQVWAREGITVNCIVPGFFPWRYWEMSAEEQSGIDMGRWVPTKKPGNPKELGPLVVFLASEASRYVTGEAIVIDGAAIEAAAAPADYLFLGTDVVD